MSLLTWLGNFFRKPYEINLAGLDIIRQSEGLRLNPYKDTDGQWKIGYGCPADPYEPSISSGDAEIRLLKELTTYESGVKNLVKRPLNENEFSALVCFTYNVGLNAFSKSTLLRKLNEGTGPNEVAPEFLKWDHVNGKESDGLKKRRQKEATLFTTPPPQSKG